VYTHPRRLLSAQKCHLSFVEQAEYAGSRSLVVGTEMVWLMLEGSLRLKLKIAMRYRTLENQAQVIYCVHAPDYPDVLHVSGEKLDY
jgi:hypothetical protein